MKPVRIFEIVSKLGFVLILAPSTYGSMAPYRCPTMLKDDVAHSTLLPGSDGITMQSRNGEAVTMHFPKSRRGPASSDGNRRARYRSVYPGIDLMVYIGPLGPEYDWIVEPGADPAMIQVSFSNGRVAPSVTQPSGAGTIRQRLNTEGDLLIETARAQMLHRRPVAYQEFGHQRRSVVASFELLNGSKVGFRVGEYDRTKRLVIDPVMGFATGVGGTFRFTADAATGIAIDGGGYIYLTGIAYATNFPLVHSLFTPSPPCPQCDLPGSVFAAKLSPDGRTILYSTLLSPIFGYSGQLPSPLSAIAVDANGNAYVATAVNGNSFVQVGGSPPAPSRGTDTMLVKLDPNGNISGSVLLGGSADDLPTSMTFGPDGKLYVAGVTNSADFPVTKGAYGNKLSSARDIFVMKIEPLQVVGNQLTSGTVLYSTLLGPGSFAAITVDHAGNVFTAISTDSTNWPTNSDAAQPTCSGRTQCADVVIAELNSAASELVFATYLGGSATESAAGIGVDPLGSIYVSGTTSSSDFPTTPGVLYPQLDGSVSRYGTSAFAAKLSPDGRTIMYATYLSINGGTTGNSLAVDAAGNAYIGGSFLDSPATTQGSNWTESYLPLIDAIQWTPFNAVYLGGYHGLPTVYTPRSGFVIVLNPAGSAPVWCTYLGGNDSVYQPSVSALALDANGTLYAAGTAISPRTTAADGSPTNSAGVVEIRPGGIPPQATYIGPPPPGSAGLPAPGGLALLYGAFPDAVAQGLPVPTELAGVSVLVDGIAAPIVAMGKSASSLTGGVLFQVPFEVQKDPAEPLHGHMVEVRQNGASAFISTRLAPPQILGIQHASDYSLVTEASPVTAGETLILYMTGLGLVTTPVADGTASAGADPVRTDCGATTVNIGVVEYAGLSAGFPGLYQINVKTYQELPSGFTSVYVDKEPCASLVPVTFTTSFPARILVQ